MDWLFIFVRVKIQLHTLLCQYSSFAIERFIKINTFHMSAVLMNMFDKFYRAFGASWYEARRVLELISDIRKWPLAIPSLIFSF